MERISLPERVFGRLFCRGDAVSAWALGTAVALFGVSPPVTFSFLCCVLLVSARAAPRAQSGEKLVPQPHEDRALGFRTAK